MVSPFTKNISLIMISSKSFLNNRFQLLGRLFFYVLTILIFSQLWAVVYEAKKGVQIDVKDMIWYIMMTEMGVLSEPYIYSKIESDIKSGDISYFLLRPISYISLRLFEGIGTFIINLPFFGLVGIITASVLSGKMLSISSFFIFSLFLTILSGIISLLIQIIIGLLTFWFEDISSLALLYRKLMYLMGGLLLPLTIYPSWIQKISYFTPFPWMIFHRSQIIYNHSFEEAFSTLLILILWGICIFAVLCIFFRICFRKITINGG